MGYSAFQDRDEESTGLYETLKSKAIQQLYICGLMYCECAFRTAIDARKLGFVTHFLTDLTVPEESSSVKKANLVMANFGVHLESTKDVVKNMNDNLRGKVTELADQ